MIDAGGDDRSRRGRDGFSYLSDGLRADDGHGLVRYNRGEAGRTVRARLR
jgi:hypothetical protein